MKKLITGLFAITFGLSIATAQERGYIVTNWDGDEYENNSSHVFNDYGVVDENEVPIDDNKLQLLIQNTSDEPIRIFGQVIEFTNTDGQKAQFCIIDACYENLIEGNLYPSNGGVFPIDGNNGFNDYFANLDETNLVEYKFRIFQADVDSGEEIEGSSFYLTYIYDEDADMNVTDVQSIAIAQVYPTVAKNFTQVNLKESAKVQIVNMQGKVVKSTQLNSGTSQLSLAGLTPGVYMVSFNGKSGMTTTVRMVVK